MDTDYDVVIVGGGIVGTSLLYTLASYSNIKRILLIERQDGPGLMNSSSANNSQTLHFGDIETNYSIEKVKETRRAANMLLRHFSKIGARRSQGIVAKATKMVLGVGDWEVELLKKRYDGDFLRVFPQIRLLDKKSIGRIEPYVVKGRDPSEALFAAYSAKGYMVDYGKLSKAFVDDSILLARGRAEVSFGESLVGIEPKKGGYSLTTSKRVCNARFVVVAAGTYTLYFAKQLGYGRNLSTVAVKGNFYHSKQVLNGKVYMVQKGKIPFLAAHGDPDMNNRELTRFGPTITLYPYLEKSRPGTILDYASSAGTGKDAILSYINIAGNRELSDLLLRNLSYSMPVVGKANFVREEVRKIVPSLSESDVAFDVGAGGIRPQIIDTAKREITLGEGKIEGDNIIFNISPSPGASSCMKTALDDAASIAERLGAKFERARFYKDYVGIPES